MNKMNKMKEQWYSIEIKLKDENQTFLFYAIDMEYSIEMKNDIFKLEIRGKLAFLCNVDSIKYLCIVPELRA